MKKLGKYSVEKVSNLIGYDRNARTHSQDQILLIWNAIEEYGFTNPLLIDENKNIIAGHGRLAAANFGGLEEVPCITISGLTDVQRKALILADNKIALNAGWDSANRKQFLIANPWCIRHKQVLHQLVPAVVVDHIKPNHLN